jgi:hypothetical protein
LRLLVKILDKKLFSSRITALRDLSRTSIWLRSGKAHLRNSSFHVNYQSVENDFAKLCHKYGSDKGSAPGTYGEHVLRRKVHNYADLYTFIFENIRPNVRAVFECGIGTNNEELTSSMGALGKPGASLRVWRDYFPNAQIIGADIDADCLFEEDRIRTFELDQTDPKAIKNTLNKIETKLFDIVIDDGLHTFEGGKILFENLIDSLAINGTYIIEDINPWDMLAFQEYFKHGNYVVYFVHLLRKISSLSDNSVIVIRKKPVSNF